jgi:hypothetical protein
MLGGLGGNLDSINNQFKSGGGVLGGAVIPPQYQNLNQPTHHNIGLADMHFRPIEIEARRIKEAQRSNLQDKLKQIETQAQHQSLTQSQIAQTKFYKNLVNKKTGPLAAAIKKDGTAGSQTAAAI